MPGTAAYPAACTPTSSPRFRRVYSGTSWAGIVTWTRLTPGISHVAWHVLLPGRKLHNVAWSHRACASEASDSCLRPTAGHVPGTAFSGSSKIRFKCFGPHGFSPLCQELGDGQRAPLRLTPRWKLFRLHNPSSYESDVFHKKELFLLLDAIAHDSRRWKRSSSTGHWWWTDRPDYPRRPRLCARPNATRPRQGTFPQERHWISLLW